MSQDLSSRLLLYEELLRRFASGVRAAQLYAADHPLLGRNVEGLLAALRGLHPQNRSVAIGIVGNQLVVAATPMPKASSGMNELIKRLRDHEIERIAFDRGVTADEISAFVHAIASLGAIMNIDRQHFSAVGLEINANHIRAKREGTVRGTATPSHVGRSTHVWMIQIVDEEERIVCVSRCTIAIVPTG